MAFEIANQQPLSALFHPLLPGIPPIPATGYQEFNGVDLAQLFTPVAYGLQGPMTGFQTADGFDLAQKFAQINTVQVTPSFNGKNFVEGVQAGTGYQGNVTATTSFAVLANGTYLASATNTINGGRPLDSGNLYPYGAPSEWEYRLTNSSGYDSGWLNGTTARSTSVSANGPAIGPDVGVSTVVNFQARRAGQANVIVNGSCGLNANLYGWG